MSTELPLFLLPVAGLPGEAIPLHVFEPRYRALVAYCEQHDEEFGVLLEEDAGTREVGCAMRIEQLERHDDGRIDLVARGTRRFALAGDVEEDVYPHASVQWIYDDVVDPHDEDHDADDAVRLFEQLGLRVTGKVPQLAFSDDDPAFAIAARVAFGQHARQGLLELRSAGGRLDLLERLLRAALARLEQVELQQAAARSNGKVHFG